MRERAEWRYHLQCRMDYLAPLEDQFNSAKVASYAVDRWHYSLYISAFYVISIFALQRYMQGRERYNLRVPLFMWSLSLALFSVLGARVTGVRLIPHLLNNGVESSICTDVIIRGREGLWAFLFCFFKLPELVDTYFIILRKQKLIFLHWYHHVTVFIYSWYYFARQLPSTQWFVVLNYIVHSVMYSYYAVRASGRLRPPIWVNMIITALQLLQMVFGVSINAFIYHKMQDSSWWCDGQVETTYFHVYWSFAMYFSYFVLFLHFFWSNYFTKSSRAKTAKNKPPHSLHEQNGLQCNGMVLQHTKNS